MRNVVWTLVSAVAVATLAAALMTWSVRRDMAQLERQRAALEARRAPFKELDALVEGFEASRHAVQLKRDLRQGVHARQAAAAGLLSALATAADKRIERVSLTPEGGEIAGRADSPVAANEVGEPLAARGLLKYELKRFERGAFTLAFTLPAASAQSGGQR